ncbi:MAG: hypothetical protein ACRYFU_22745 [Janthinobacterium lividum]
MSPASRSPKAPVLIAAALALLSIFLLVVSTLRNERTVSSPASGNESHSTSVTAASPDAVKVGLQVQAFGPIDVEAHTFAAEFALWLVAKPSFEPSDLTFPDAVTPVRLGEPVSLRMVGADQYRLFHVSGLFHFRLRAEDVVAGRLQLGLRIRDTKADQGGAKLVADMGASRLVPEREGARGQTKDGQWSVFSATLDQGNVAVTTYGDPGVAAPVAQHSEITAAVTLVPTSPNLAQRAQRLIPPTFALTLAAMMVCLLAVLAFLPGPDSGSFPWRLIDTLGALTLMLLAVERLFGTQNTITLSWRKHRR